MWQDTLKYQGPDDIECDLHTPVIKSLRIIRKKKQKKKWNDWDVLNQMNDLQEEVYDGKLEVSKQSFMTYLAEHFPGLDEDLYMSVCEKNLGDFLEGIVKAYVADGYEANKPPENAGDDHLLKGTIYADSVESISDEQSKAVDFIVKHDRTISSIILKAIHEQCRGVIEHGTPRKGFKEKPASPEDMRTLCTCEGVRIIDESFQGMAYTEFDFSTTWLGPDQWLKAVMHGDRLVHFGGSGDDWEDPEA